MRSYAAAVASLALLVAVAACGPAAAPPPSPSTAVAVPTAVASPAASPTVDAHAALDQRARLALVGPTSYGSLGYGDGVDTPITRTRPTAEVCNSALDIDKTGYRTVAARQWTKDKAVVVLAVYGYEGARAADGISQIRTAVGSCTTYTVNSPEATYTYTIAAPVTLGPFYGTDSSYGFCQQRAMATEKTSTCLGYIAFGNLLSVVAVGVAGDQTSDAFAELLHLADGAAQALTAA